MAIEWYEPKAHTPLALGDFARCSNDHLKFSNEVHEKMFYNNQTLYLGYDQNENAIHLVPKKDKGQKISVIRGNKTSVQVFWRGFLTKHKIHFDKPCDIKIQDSQDKKTKKILLANCK